MTPDERRMAYNLKEVQAISDAVLTIMEKGGVSPQMGLAAMAYAMGIALATFEKHGVNLKSETLFELIRDSRKLALTGSLE